VGDLWRRRRVSGADRREAHLRRVGRGTSAASAAAVPSAATPPFARSYSSTHYMSMGSFNSPPKKYRCVGIFDASDELAARVMTHSWSTRTSQSKGSREPIGKTAR
jgi:hypothetical protein